MSEDKRSIENFKIFLIIITKFYNDSYCLFKYVTQFLDPVFEEFFCRINGFSYRYRICTKLRPQVIIGFKFDIISHMHWIDWIGWINCSKKRIHETIMIIECTFVDPKKKECIKLSQDIPIENHLESETNHQDDFPNGHSDIDYDDSAHGLEEEYFMNHEKKKQYMSPIKVRKMKKYKLERKNKKKMIEIEIRKERDWRESKNILGSRCDPKTAKNLLNTVSRLETTKKFKTVFQKCHHFHNCAHNCCFVCCSYDCICWCVHCERRMEECNCYCYDDDDDY